MLRENKILNHRNAILLFGTFFFVQMILLNFLHGLYADDWFYSLIWQGLGGYDAPKVTSIGDIIQSQFEHYHTWGGRCVAHCLAQFFIMLPSWIFDIVNSVILIAFLTLMYCISNKGRPANACLYILLMLFMWFAHPVFPSTTIWLTGSCNYLWCTLLILLFIYPYFNFYWNRKEDEQNKCLFTILFFLFGIVAGWTNENMSPAMIIFVLAIIAFTKRSKLAVPKWAYAGLSGAVIGCALLLLAPGNRARSIVSSPYYGKEEISLLHTIAERLNLLLDAYVAYILPLSVIFILLLAYKYLILKDRDDKRFYVLPLLFVAVAHLAFFAMVATPIFPPRATFGINTFMLIGIGMLYASIDFKFLIIKIGNLVFLLLLFAYYLYSYSVIHERLVDMDRIWTNREKKIEEAKQRGELDITFDDLYIAHKRLDIYDLSGRASKWENKCYSAYYEIDSVRRISKDDYKLNLYPQE